MCKGEIGYEEMQEEKPNLRKDDSITPKKYEMDAQIYTQVSKPLLE
jgi:hypothetical protein